MKKTQAVFISLLVSVILLAAVVSASECIDGDANGDGKINSVDVVYTLRYIAGWDVSIDEAQADMNDDGKVSSSDVVLILRRVAGWDLHKWSEWRETKAATETGFGTEQNTCSVCNEKKYRDIPKIIKGHTHSYSDSVTKEATCEAEGVRTFTCSCGAKYEEVIERTAHNYLTSTYDATCIRDGYEKVFCKDCGEVISDTVIPATGKHNYRTITCAEAYREAKTYKTDIGSFIVNVKNADDWLVDMCSCCHRWDESTRRSKYSDEEACKIMLGYVNELRNSVELKWNAQVNLIYDEKLTELANIRAEELYTIAFSHDGAYGKPRTKTNAAENIAKTTTQSTLEGHFNGWKASPGHYKNMISDYHVRFGYGRYMDDNGIVYGVQLFWDDGIGADNYMY